MKKRTIIFLTERRSFMSSLLSSPLAWWWVWSGIWGKFTHLL